MPNININESDKSNFLDQQFIQIAYNGKTNIKSTPLTYRVTFTVDGNPYYIVDIGENQKISAPSVAPTKEGYTFKNWLLNGEAFDFSTVITSDILLIAEFEEAPVEDVIWEDTLAFVSAEEVPGWVQYDSTGTGTGFPAIDDINTTDTFTLSIPELNKSTTGKFVFDESTNYMIGGIEDGVMLQAADDFYLVAVEGEAGTYSVKLTKSAAPTLSHSWTWDGVKAEGDIENEGTVFHKVADETFTAEQLDNAVMKYIERSGDETVFTLVNREAQTESEVQLQEMMPGVVSCIDGLFMSGIVEEMGLDGTYLTSYTNGGGETSYTSSLTLAE